MRMQSPLTRGGAPGTAVDEKNWFPPGYGPEGGGIVMVEDL